MWQRMSFFPFLILMQTLLLQISVSLQLDQQTLGSRFIPPIISSMIIKVASAPFSWHWRLKTQLMSATRHPSISRYDSTRPCNLATVHTSTPSSVEAIASNVIFRNKTTRTEKKIPETPCVHSHEIHTSRYSSLNGRTLQPAQTTTREVTDWTAEERKKKPTQSNKSIQTLVAVFIIQRRSEGFGGGGWRCRSGCR